MASNELFSLENRLGGVYQKKFNSFWMQIVEYWLEKHFKRLDQ
jgi:hypothetical protein